MDERLLLRDISELGLQDHEAEALANGTLTILDIISGASAQNCWARLGWAYEKANKNANEEAKGVEEIMLALGADYQLDVECPDFVAEALELLASMGHQWPEAVKSFVVDRATCRSSMVRASQSRISRALLKLDRTWELKGVLVRALEEPLDFLGHIDRIPQDKKEVFVVGALLGLAGVVETYRVLGQTYGALGRPVDRIRWTKFGPELWDLLSAGMVRRVVGEMFNRYPEMASCLPEAGNINRVLMDILLEDGIPEVLGEVFREAPGSCVQGWSRERLARLLARGGTCLGTFSMRALESSVVTR